MVKSHNLIYYSEVNLQFIILNFPSMVQLSLQITIFDFPIFNVAKFTVLPCSPQAINFWKPKYYFLF